MRKLSSSQMYINLCLSTPKKPSYGFFWKPKKVVPPTHYCPKCHFALTTTGRCVNDLECDFKK